MGQGYGHDHRDKFSLTLHGAGRLFYPDFNALQYEKPSIGWTMNSVAHNTLLVDEQDTRNASPMVYDDFNPDVKFLATSASGVFENVDQTQLSHSPRVPTGCLPAVKHDPAHLRLPAAQLRPSRARATRSVSSL